MTTLNKSQQREISKVIAMSQDLGTDFVARSLSALYRSALKKSQQTEILIIATLYKAVSSKEFII